MANYLFMMISKDKESIADEFFFSENTLEHEDLVKTSKNEVINYYISKGANSKNSNGNEFFKGYCINYSDKVISYSPSEHLNIPKDGLDGCYIHIENKENKCYISNDYFSQLPIYFFANQNCFACSDSLFSLYKLRKALGLPVKLDIESIKSRAWINSITNQLISDKTSLSAIKFLTPQNFLEVNISNGRPYAQVKKAVGASNSIETDYVSAVRDAAIKIRSVISSLLKNYPLSLSLSGGLDSRIILAGAIKSNSFKNLNIGTNEKITLDYKIVKGLSDNFGFEFNSREKFLSTKTRNLDRLSTYILLSCGSYDSIYCPKRVPVNSLPIPVTGHGAELYKGNYGLRSIEEISEACPINKTLFFKELQTGINKLNTEIDSKLSGEKHYFGYRNALHGARSTIFSLYALRPLMQKELANFFMRDSSPDTLEHRKLAVKDLLILLSPELSSFEFDIPSKNLEKTYIEDRLSFLGGPINEKDIFDFNINGNPNENESSLSNFFLQLAKSDGHTGELSFSSLKNQLFDDSLNDIPELKKEIEYWKNHIGDLEASDTKINESHNATIGKLLSIKIFKELKNSS